MKGGNELRIHSTRRSRLNFFHVVRTRHSVRSYLPTQVSRSTLRRLLTLARYTPSSMNERATKIFVIRDARTKARIVRHKNIWSPPEKEAYRADFLAHAPVLLIVCAHLRKSHERHLENGVIAATYLLLGATALGLGSTFLTAYHPRRPEQARELKKILHIPASYTPVAILPIGYPAEQTRAKKSAQLFDAS